MTAITMAPTPELQVADNLSFPLGLVVQKLAILARSGAGKTNTAVVIVEHLLSAGQQVVVLDPPGAWWGLRSSADGKAAGFPVAVLGGPHADVPLDPTAGAVVADLVVDERLSAVVDLSDFTDGEIARFVSAFAQRLYARKNTARTPMMLVLEEADELAPQNLPASNREKGETSQAMMLHHVERIAKRGRMRGIGLLAISQRSASLNKHVLSQIELLIVMQTTAPQDIAAIDEWIKHHGDQERRQQLLSEIASLPIGTAFVWSPAWLSIFVKTAIHRRRTFDSSATPEPGREMLVPGKLAQVNLVTLRDKLAVTIAKAANDDPAELRKRIAQLERQLGQHTPDVASVIERLQSELGTTQRQLEEARAHPVPVFTDEEKALMRDIAQSSQAHSTASAALMERTNELLARLLEIGRRYQVAPAIELPPVQPTPIVAARRMKPASGQSATPAPDPILRVPPKPEPNGSYPHDLSGPQQRVVDVLATLHQLGLKAADRVQVAAFSGYADPTTRRFREAVTFLERVGLVSYPIGGQLALTDAGQGHTHERLPITGVQDLHDAWYQRLKGPRDRVLWLLIDKYPDALSREDLANQAGYSDPTTRRFRTAVTSLEKLGLAHYPVAGTVAATDLLFPPELLDRARVGTNSVVFPKRKPGRRPR